MKTINKQLILFLTAFIFTSFQFFAQTSITNNFVNTEVNGATLGQSFTATQDGVIKNIQVVPNNSNAHTLSIYSGAGFGGVLLHTQEVTLIDLFNNSSDYSFQTIVIDAQVNITNGNVYTFRFSGNNSFGLSTSNPYAGGTLHDGNGIIAGWDLPFIILQGGPDTAPVAGAGTALDFDGINDFVALNSTTFGNFGTADFTVEGWIKTTKDKKRFVLGKRAASGATTPLWNVFINASGTLGFEIKQISSANNGDLTGTTDVGDGNWHHFAVTRSATTTTVFIDGVQEAQKNPTTNGGGITNLSNATSFKLGKAFNSTDTFKGQMDEIRVWNVARTLSEIQNNRFKILTGNETNLAALFRLDEGTGTIVNDATSNNNDGTLTNMDPATDWLSSTTWQNRTILEDATLVINPEGYDVDGAIGTSTQSSAPSNGTLTFAPLTYTPTANFNGSDSFTYQVNSNGLNDTYTINVTVSAVNDVPVASNVTFTGTLKVGQQLTGSYTYADADNDIESGSTYKWYRSDDNTGTNKAAISGATATTYTLVTADAHKYISFEVTPKDGTAFGTAVESPLQVVVNTVPSFTSTAIISIDENQTYTYTVSTNDTDNDAVTLTAPTLPTWLSLNTNYVVSTLAGSGTLGSANGTGTAAQFYSPFAVTVDASGNVYVADSNNNLIRKITSAGEVTTLAGSGIAGFADGTGTAVQFYHPKGVAVDVSGNVYVADLNNNKIRKITPVGVVTTLAGSGVFGFNDGTAAVSQFANPRGVAVDASGNVYVADTNNNKIRKITAAGVVTTLAGSGTYGFSDGTGSSAQFATPSDVAVDDSGNVYVGDTDNQRIRKITSAGVVSTLAGSGTNGFTDGTASSAQFNTPFGVAVDASGNVYVADIFNQKIRKISAAGVVTTLAGSTFGFADGIGTDAQFKNPYGVAVDISGNVYVAGNGSHSIRKITVSTILTGDTTGQAGTHNVVLNANDGNSGSTNQSFTITVNDITAPTISSLTPADNAIGILIGSNLVLTFNENVQKGTGNILIKDAADNSTVQTIDVTTSAVSITNAVVTINPTSDLLKSKNYYIQIPNTAFTDTSSNAYAGIAGTTTWNFATELNTAPTATSVTFSGTIKVGQLLTGSYTYTDIDSDTESGTTFKWYRSDDNISTNKAAITGATVTTYTLTTADAHKYISFEVTPKDGTAFGTAVESPLQVVVNTVPSFTSTAIISIDENQTYTYTVSTNDTDNDAVTLTVPTLPSWLSLTTGSTTVNTLAGSGTSGAADGTGTAAQFNSPVGVAVDGSGTFYVADKNNHRIRKITAAGVVSTLAGSGTQGFADGTGTAAQFNNPVSIAVDASGTVYVADQSNHRIRKITPVGVVTTLAGSTQGFADGTGTAAQFNVPQGVAVDASGTVYVSDQFNRRIRKITPAGVVTTLAGSGTAGFADGTGTAAQFNNPVGVAVDASGTVYVGDRNNNRVRKITSAGVVTTLAGSTQGFADGTGTAAQFILPSGVAVDASGIVYVADQYNHRIRKITPAGVVTTLAGSGSSGFADGTGTAAQFSFPSDVAVDASGIVYVADVSNHRIRKIIQDKVLTGDTTGQAGTHNVILNANDGKGGSTNQSFTITVNDITVPTLSSLAPTDNATGVLIGSNLVLTFDENVQKGTGNILIKDAADNSTVQTIDVTTSAVSISSAVVSINPPTDLLKNKNYYIQIPTTAFTDTSSNAYAGIADTTTWNFATELNNAPTVTGGGIPDQTKNEDFTSFNIDLKPYFSDVETADTSLLYTVQTTTSNVINMSINSGIATITANSNLNGSETLTIRVQDPEGLFIEDAFIVTVNAVNDVPTISPIQNQTILEDAVEQTINLTGLSAGPTNEAAQTLTVTATSNNTALIPNPIVTYTSGNATGTLKYTPQANINGTATITVTVSDNGGGATNQIVITFVITVNAVNDAPTATSVTFTGTLEIAQVLTGSYIYADTENDVESGTTYKWYRSDDNAGTNKAVISGATTSSYTLSSSDAAKYISFEVTPKDGTAFGTAVESALQGAVVKKTPTLTFTNISKVYGAVDFNLGATSNSTGSISYSIVTGGTGTATLSGTNNQTVSLGNVGTVTIRASLTADADYNAATKDITLTITAKAITITADAKSKVYGATDPSLTYQITTGALVGSDALSGGLTRVTGEAVGTYAISSTLANSNYGITYVSADFTITSASIVATTQAASSITTTGVILNGTIYDGGATATTFFEWGLASGLTGATTSSGTPASITAGSGTTSVGLTLTGLTDNTIYYYRIKGTNTQGTVNGTIMSFTTLDGTPPSIVTTIPADNATNITSSNLELVFDEDIQKGTGDILIKRTSDNNTVATIAVNSTEVTINNTSSKGTATAGRINIHISPSITLPSNTAMHIEIPNTAFEDLSGNAFPGFSLNTTWNFSTDAVLGIENNIIKGFAMYPNPASDNLNIRTQEPLRSVQVYNLMGQQVLQKNLNTTHTTIDLSRLPQGTYFVKIKTDKTAKAVKFIKE